MTVEQAKQKLSDYRNKQRELRKKIEALRKFLRDKGVDPDPPPIDLTERNNAMYSRYLDGLSWEEIANEFKLSKQRVKDICARVEIKREKMARKEKEESEDD